MSDISKIKIDNTIYQIKDAISRSGIYQEVSDWVIGSSSLDTFDKTGLYIFNNIDRGNVVNDGIPITNDGLFSARLEVLNIGNNVSQILHLHNDEGGDINIYTRFKNENTGWESWGKLQTNIEVGQVNTLDNLIDNGVYSGVLTDGTTSSLGTFYDTFVLIVINNYSVAGPLGRQRSISQLKYNLTLDGIVKIEKRVRYTNDIWSDWEIIGGNFAELEEKVNKSFSSLMTAIDDKVGIMLSFGDNTGNLFSTETIIPIATEKISTGLLGPNENGYLTSLIKEKTFSIEFVEKNEFIRLYDQDYSCIPKGVEVQIISDNITYLCGYYDASLQEPVTIMNGVILEKPISILQNYEEIGEVTIKYRSVVSTSIKDILIDIQRDYIEAWIQRYNTDLDTYIQIPSANADAAGLLSATDKVKLDNIDSITILSTPPIDVIKEEFLNNFYPQRDNNNKLINVGNFRSYSSYGTSHLDIKVTVLAWANELQKECFMQTVCGPITINNNDKTLVWINGKVFSNYYRTSSRDEDNNLIWSEWKIVNESEINKKIEELASFLSKLKTAFGIDDLDAIVSKLASLK